MQKELLLEMIRQNQLTCSFSFDKIDESHLNWTLNEGTASIGFIFRHIGESIHLFGYFFGLPTEVKNTTMGQKDSGTYYPLDESLSLVADGFQKLEQYVRDTPDHAWQDRINTPFFGTVSRFRIFSHILFHNSHHAGQISLTLAKGSPRFIREYASSN